MAIEGNRLDRSFIMVFRMIASSQTGIRGFCSRGDGGVV
jgi:hypothetical protein